MNYFKISIIFALLIISLDTDAQEIWLSRIPSLSKDTVLILDKEAAIRQANFNLTHIEIRNRFAAALTREEKLRLLWEKTEVQLQAEKDLSNSLKQQILLLEQEIEVRSDESDALEKVVRKGKRKSFIQGGVLGFLAGAILTAYIISD